MQCCDPGREDLCHRRYREQRGSGPRKHGNLWPLHQHLGAPAVTTLPTLQARLCGHQKVHPERLRAARTRSHWVDAKHQLSSGCGMMHDGSLGAGRSVGQRPLDLMPASIHPVTRPTPQNPCAECTHIQLLSHVKWQCLTSSTVCVMVVVHPLIQKAQGPS